MSDEKYNGWTNYETWVTKLWIDNDQGSYDYWQERAASIAVDAEASKFFTKKEQATLDLSKALEEWHEELLGELYPQLAGGASVFTDLMNKSLGRVEWHEIAKNMLDMLEE